MVVPAIIIGANIVALLLAMGFNYPVNEIYAFLAFNMILFLFIGFVNLVALVKENILQKEDETDDTTGTFK